VKLIVEIVTAVAFVVTLYLVLGLIVMASWNWSMPALFALPRATWLNGVGLALLAASFRSGKRSIAKP
jgi:hypothetical protein